MENKFRIARDTMVQIFLHPLDGPYALTTLLHIDTSFAMIPRIFLFVSPYLEVKTKKSLHLHF